MPMTACNCCGDEVAVEDVGKCQVCSADGLCPDCATECCVGYGDDEE